MTRGLTPLAAAAVLLAGALAGALGGVVGSQQARFWPPRPPPVGHERAQTLSLTTGDFDDALDAVTIDID